MGAVLHDAPCFLAAATAERAGAADAAAHAALHAAALASRFAGAAAGDFLAGECGHRKRFAAPAATVCGDAAAENQIGEVRAAGAICAAAMMFSIAVESPGDAKHSMEPSLFAAFAPAVRAALRGAASRAQRPWPAPACAKTPGGCAGFAARRTPPLGLNFA